MGNGLRSGLVLLICALALAGCGVAGPLEPPGGMTTETRASPAAPKHDPFVLDPVLR